MVLDEKRSGRSKIEMNLSTEGDRTPGIEDFTQVDGWHEALCSPMIVAVGWLGP